jgi:cytoskeletal protein CcmA (bactofilin family)
MWKQRSDEMGEGELKFAPEAVRSPASATDQAIIGRGVVVKGDVSGADPVFVEGRVEGTIHVPGERVTVGKDGSVMGRADGSAPCITAREIVVMGTVMGDVSAGERVDIRAGGSLTGDVTTVRVSIEDGAFFRGGIDIRREDPKIIPAAARFETVQPV